jgi:uncharacterized protein (DUF433 family)
MVARSKPNDLEHRSFRLPRRLLGEIKRRAERRGVSQTTLVERYLEEGIRMDEHPLIVFRDSPLGRRAMLAGSRLEVSQVIATIRNSGDSLDDAAEYLDLPVARVRACLSYYAAYQREVDAYAAETAAASAEAERAWRREQDLIGA